MADTVYAADGLTGIQSMLILGVTFLLVCMLTEYGDSYFRARFLRAANILASRLPWNSAGTQNLNQSRAA